MLLPTAAAAQSPPTRERSYQASYIVNVRERLLRSSTVVEAEPTFYSVFWLGTAAHAPFVGLGGTLSLGAVLFSDPTVAGGVGNAGRFSTGPSVRLGYGTTGANWRNGRIWYVALSLSTVLIVPIGTYPSSLPERGGAFAVRSGLTFAAPGWPHHQDAAEDYVGLLTIFVPASIELSVEVLPGRDAVRLGIGVGWGW